MNNDNVILQGCIQHGNFYDCDEWILQSIDPIKYNRLNKLYYFYNKFELIKIGFIKAEFINKNSKIFLKLKKHIISYPNEWSLSMIRDASIFHLKLFEKLYLLDLALKSTSLQNIIFDYNNLVFTDLETLRMRDEETLLPMSVNDGSFKAVISKVNVMVELLKIKKYQEIREILCEVRPFFVYKKIDKILSQFPELKDTIEKAESVHNKELSSKITFVEQCEYLANLVMSVDFTSALNASKSSVNLLERNAKQNFVRNILSDYSPRTVLDVGAKDGTFSFLAAKQGAGVVAINDSEYFVDYIYNQSKKRDLKILSLIMPFKAMNYRISCDLVMCLDLLPQLILEQNICIDEIFRILKGVTNHILILEFVDKYDLNISTLSYNLEKITQIGLKYFSKVSVLDSYPMSNKILVFEK